jgi:hypothetical protein
MGIPVFTAEDMNNQLRDRIGGDRESRMLSEAVREGKSRHATSLIGWPGRQGPRSRRPQPGTWDGAVD